MTMFLAPYTAIADIDGSPLDAGFIYLGEYGENPETSPIEVYFDADFTIPAAQPIRTRNGYPVRNGSPCKIYLKQAEHSLVIKNKNLSAILVEMNNKGISSSLLVRPNGDTVETSLTNIDAELNSKQQQIDEKPSQQYVDEELDLKAPKETTYTKTEVDTALSLKAPQSNTYTKAEVDTTFAAYVGGRKAYTTLALAQAAQSSLPANTAIEVTNDGANNGTYQWNGTILTKSAYDPLTQAKTHTDSEIALFNTDLTEQSQNLYNKHTNISGKYINSSGVITSAAGWSVSSYIPVVAGESYTISSTDRRVGLAFYAANYSYIAGSYNETKDVTLVAPPTAAFLVINVDSTTVTGSDIQVELGTEATEYAEYLVIKESKLPMQDLFSRVKTLTDKPYEAVIQSKNLFNPAAIVTGKYINTSGVITSQTGWSISDYIPATAGLPYAVSAEARRVGLAFYNSSKVLIAGSYNESNPAVVTAPAGAAYLVINVDSTAVASSKVQVEQSAVVTAYESFGEITKIDPSYINFTNETIPLNTINIAGFRAVLNGMLDDATPIEIKLVVDRPLSHSKSSVFNFEGDTVNGILQRSLGDDVAPMRLDGYTIGANHGFQRSDLTLAAHGKTTADIGSVWLSGGKEYVIVDIVSTSVLSITARTDNTAFALAELTHVSGATNTASFTPTSTAADQWYPAIRDRKITCFVDNKLIDLSIDATHEFTETVKFLESYSIMRKTDMVEWLIANKGQNYLNYAAVPCYTVNFGYTFDRELGCTIYFGGVGRKAVALQDQMITQSIQLAQGNSTVYNYIPKAVEFTAGGFTYNFSQLENLYSKNPSVALYLTAARQEAGVNPIDRIVMLNDQVGYATGYLPVLDAAPDVRVTNASNKYLEIRNGTLKLYPRLIDSSSITQINDGDAFAAIAYRKYFKRSVDRTCKYVIRSEMGDYLYLDWHTAKTDEIELPADLVGREFEVHEKSSNVTLLSKFASHSILVKVDSTKSYGYLVLKFK